MFRYLNLEVGLLTGLTLLVMGSIGSIAAFSIWENNLFGSLDPVQVMKIVSPSVTCLAMGFQTIFSSFFLSVLGLKRR